MAGTEKWFAGEGASDVEDHNESKKNYSEKF